MFIPKSNTKLIFDIKSPEGFENIYRKYFKKVYGICYYQTKDKKLSQDMSQDIFLSLWKRRESLIIKISLEYYLIRAAKLETMSYFRTQANRKRQLETKNILVLKEDNSTENQIIFNELTLEVNNLVSKLPEQAKKVYTLSREKGISNKEIASVLNITEKGVEYHITKVLSYLRKNLVVSLR